MGRSRRELKGIQSLLSERIWKKKEELKKIQEKGFPEGHVFYRKNY